MSYRCIRSLVLVVLALALSACGSSRSEDDAVDPVAGGSEVPAILDQYLAGSHAATLQGVGIAVCSRCHSDEGYRAFIEQTRGFDEPQLLAALTNAEAPADLSTVQCQTCHDGAAGELRAPVTVDAQNGTVFSRQFNLCTSCHQVFLEASFDPVAQSFSYSLDRTRRPFHGTAGNPLADGNGLVIWDTHFASPADGIAGYGIDAASAQACTTCHDPHLADKFASLVVAPL